MPEFELNYWHWLIAMLMLLGLELFAPGGAFLWLGVAAGITGVLKLLIPVLPWQLQIVIFAVTAVGSIFAWRHYKKLHPATTDQPKLNRRGEQYIGQVVTLVTAIQGGTGRVQLGDGQWKVIGPDLPAGTQVKIVNVDGAVLQVEPE